MIKEEGEIQMLKMKVHIYAEEIKRLKELRMPQELNCRLESIEEVLCSLMFLIQNKKKEETEKKRGSSVGKKLRGEILHRDNYTCRNCGKSGKGFEEIKLHIDHIIPKTEGGKGIPSNLQVLCSKCNLLKKNYLFNEYADKSKLKKEVIGK